MPDRDLKGVREHTEATPSRGPSSEDGSVDDLLLEHLARTPIASPPPVSLGAGRFVVRRLLGEGGQKRVYLVHDTALDRECALSLLCGESLGPSTAERLRREAQAIARVGPHPQIVTIYDIGEEDGRPYIACEYLAGGDLRGALRAAGGSLPLERALDVARDICRALAFAHSHGIVHRDVKPENVWLSVDGAAKLGDFGLALALDRSRLTLEGFILGSASYIAPEQALGQPVDARTDLYSLGCVLYELVTGRPPFTGPDSMSVISQHVHVSPVAPRERNSAIPGALDRLLLRMLAKVKEERPGSAHEVLSALEQVQSGRPSQDQQRNLGAAADLLQRFSATHFIGRRTELGQLKSALEQALVGKGGMYVVTGEPGIGKTRLIQELGLYGRVRGARVLSGHCTEDTGAPPYLPILEAMDSHLRDCQSDQIGQLLGSEAPLLIRLFPQLATYLPDLRTGPTPIGEPDRYVLFQAVASVFRKMAEPSGLLLVLEDLHWASSASLILLHHLGRQLRNSKLLVVGTYRDVEVDRGHPLVSALAELRREQLCERIPLHGLSLQEIRLMIGGAEAPEQLARAFLRETEGNPLFICEILKYLTEEGRIGRDRGPEAMAALSMDVLGIPEEVREVIRRRLSRLSVETRQMLTLASAIGTSFRWEMLVAASGEIEGSLLDRLDQALAAQIVREKGSRRSGTYEFTHALIRHTLYSEISTPRRVLLHKEIGEAIERLHRPAQDRYLAELAHHYYEATTAGGAEKALEYSMRAGDRAISVLAYEDAAAHYARALEVLDGVHREARAHSDLRADIHAKRAMAFAHIGSWEDAKREFETALKAMGPDRRERRAEVLVDLAMVCFWAQDVPALRRHASEALELAEAVEREDLAVGAQGALAAAVSADDGKVRESIHGLRKALARADRPATGPVARGLQMYSLQLYWVGEFQEAIAVAREAAKTARAVGDAFLLMAALPQLGLALSGCGRYGEAVEVFEEARRFGREHRIGGFFARAIAMSAGLHFNLFDDGRAEELIREARELALSVNFSPPALNGGLELLRIHARREEIALGEKLVGEVAREVESAVAWHGWLWKIRFAQGRAELALARRDWEVAHQLASDVIARSRATGRVKYAAEGHLARARALDGLRQGSAAAAERKAAVGLVRQMGDPAALIRTAAQVLLLDDDPVLGAEARRAIEQIAAALPDGELRRRFHDAKAVRSLLR